MLSAISFACRWRGFVAEGSVGMADAETLSMSLPRVDSTFPLEPLA